MKVNPSSPGALPRYLTAALLLSTLPMTGQTIVNGNFDTDTFGVFPGYVSGNGAITGWTASPADRVGLNTSAGPFANSGTIPSAPNAAFIQAGASGPASLSQAVTGLTIGTKYKVTARVSARGGNTPTLVFSTDVPGHVPVKLEVTPVGANPFKTVAFEFTATETSHLITLTNDRTAGDHTLVLDDVAVVAASTSSTWAIAPWFEDADSGVDSQYVYTHAVSFGSNEPVTINGVNFTGRETGVAGRFAIADLGNTFGNRIPNNVTGDSANLAKDFRYGGLNGAAITLQNLKPNTEYVFTAYGLAFDAAGTYRSATFGSSVPGSDKLSVNLNQYGEGNGIRVDYTYTTDGLGTPVVISYPATGSGSWHTSGFSNREAIASSPPVAWTIQPWTDDASSGVSPNHVYTHALSFGSTVGMNLNGVDFTGIAGGNPAGVNYTSANLPGNFTNDPNNVTGYGSPMARNFVYDGFPAVHNLTGLTPGKDYVFTLYSVGWDDGYRPAGFIGGIGEQKAVLNQDEYGNNQGLRFEYTYTADASGTAKITVSGFDGAKSIHTYGISNREADAMVGVAPAITLQPTGASVGTGGSYVMRVGAIGSETLSYQWKLDGADLPGENGPVLNLGFVDFTNAGDYTVFIENGDGDVTSDIATLVVLDNVPGVFGTGLGADGFPLAAGQADPHFTLIVNPDDTNSDVSLVQSNIPGSWLPNSGTSQWIGPRADTAGAAAMSTDDGEGLGTYVYRTQIDLTSFDLSTVKIQGSWASDNSGLEIRVNGVGTGIVNNTGVTFGALQPFVIDTMNAPGLIAGVNTIDFVVNNEDVATGFTGLRVDGFSAIGLIPPGTPPHIALQPVSANGPHNGTVILSVAASGSAPLSYQWFKGVDPLVGETNPELYVDIFDYSPAGDYKVVVSNGSAPDAESDIATITVTNANPVVVDDEVSTTEDTPLPIDVLFDMLDNDTDADGDFVELAGFSATSFNGGTVTEEFGTITYTPAPGFSGLDGFSYTVTDGWGGTSAAGTVLITVEPAADVPPGDLTLVVDLDGGSVTGSFTGTPGVTYVLERSTTMIGAWDPIDTVVAPPSGVVDVEDLDPPAGKAFYRISYPD